MTGIFMPPSPTIYRIDTIPSITQMTIADYSTVGIVRLACMKALIASDMGPLADLFDMPIA